MCSLQHPMLCIACGDEDAAQPWKPAPWSSFTLPSSLSCWKFHSWACCTGCILSQYQTGIHWAAKSEPLPSCLTLYTCGCESDWNTWILSLGGWANTWRLLSGAGGSSQSLKLTLVYQSCDDNIRLIFRSTQSLKLCMFWSLFLKQNLFFVSVYGDFLFHFISI